MKLLGRFGWALFGLALLFTYGCSQLGVLGERGKVDPETESEVQHVVWRLVMDANRLGPPPAIRWVTGADLNCTDPNSGQPGFQVVVWADEAKTKVQRVCRGGYTVGPTAVSVALISGAALSDLPVAHEYGHAKLVRQLRGNPLGDPNHREPEFTPLALCGGCSFTMGPGLDYCHGYEGAAPSCTKIYRNPCGACGEVDWANEQLKRLGR